ncbi:YdbL family protein [Algihabitans albus]|uniref:YdbL family protein n=1 Tax=Algihabitans albus TaxID=2164067 RepID=UPI0013C32EB4|nr:YdbL family protein [Algihabitans albus]
MPTTRRSFLLQSAGTLAAGLALGGAVLTGASRDAQAQSAEDLKRRGLAGENLNGFLVARDASVEARVEAINAERSQVYRQRAAQQGVDANTIGQIYAQEIIEASPPGTWYQSSGGQWVQK